MILRRLTIVASIALLIGIVNNYGQAQSPALAPVAKPLNVLLIISDDLRCELGCYGVARAHTPNIDALAKSGVCFERAYCQFPLCNPSRSSMLTGCYPSSTDVLGNRDYFGAQHPDFITLPRWFKDHGYDTLRMGKIFHEGIDDTEGWTEGGEARRFGEGAATAASAAAPQAPQAADAADGGDGQTPSGGQAKADRSDRWEVLPGEGERNGDYRNATRAIETLQKRKNTDKPFFLALGQSKPHSPPQAPQSCFDLYSLDAIELPQDFAPRPTVPPGFPRQTIRAKNADLFIGRDASKKEAREVTRAYLASVSFVDRNVGRVIAELDRLNMRENTVIVFWGDHGYQLGEKGKWSKAGSLWEQGARSPLIVVAPHAAGNGHASSRIVEALDIYPTLVELCGLPLPTGLEGRSLAPLLADPQAAWDHPAFTIWSEGGRTATGVAVRTEKWRYAEYDNGAAAMLLDETADPHEVKNVVDDPANAEVRSQLSKLVREHRARYPAP